MEQPSSQPQEKKESYGWVIVFLIIGGIIWFFSSSGSESTQNSINQKQVANLSDTVVSCKYKENTCSSMNMKQSACSESVCCNLGISSPIWIVSKDAQSCQCSQQAMLNMLNSKKSSGYTSSGFEAGYQRAEEKDIDDVSNCTGNSSSFIEGCEQYVMDMAEDFPEEYSY